MSEKREVVTSLKTAASAVYTKVDRSEEKSSDEYISMRDDYDDKDYITAKHCRGALVIKYSSTAAKKKSFLKKLEQIAK